MPQVPSKVRNIASPPAQIAALGAVLDIDFWRNTRRDWPAKDTAAVASYDGRGHRAGEPVPVYGANPRLAADDEFLYAHPIYSGMEIRSTKLTGRLWIVDGTQEAVAATLEATVAQLSDPQDRSVCQRVTHELFRQGAHAFKVRSARARTHGDVLIVERSAARELLKEEEIVYRTIVNTDFGGVGGDWADRR